MSYPNLSTLKARCANSYQQGQYRRTQLLGMFARWLGREGREPSARLDDILVAALAPKGWGSPPDMPPEHYQLGCSVEALIPPRYMRLLREYYIHLEGVAFIQEADSATPSDRSVTVRLSRARLALYRAVVGV